MQGFELAGVILFGGSTLIIGCYLLISLRLEGKRNATSSE